MSIDEKGQPVSKREAVIEAMARAMSYERAKERMFSDSEISRQIYVDKRWSDCSAAAQVAFAAALSVLSVPDEGMIEAGIGDHRCYAEDAVTVWKDMLSTLRSPEK